jgi:mono/diheme cytochrome c family protein
MRDRLIGRLAVCATLAVIASPGLAPAAEAPVVAGYHRLRDEAKAAPAVAGELLLAELNCTACHAPADGAQERVGPKGTPDLSAVGARVTPQWLRAYLREPHAVKPGATMPDLLHGAEGPARDAAVENLAHFLASLGGPIEPASRGGNVLLVDQGRELYHTVGCVACHAPETAKGPAAMPKTPAVPHGDLASKTTVERLAEFLLDPLKTRPHGRMPATELMKPEAEAIAVYLLREQMDNPQAAAAEPARQPGVKFAYYEGNVQDVRLETLDRLQPVSEGRTDTFTIDVPGRKANDQFALKFTGAIRIPRDGKYTFHARSDDGTRLFIDGRQVIDNDGTHAPQQKSASLELKSGEHPLTLTYFEGGGGEELKVEWEGPGIDRQEIPGDVLISVGGRPMIPLRSESFTVDPQKARAGRTAFATVGCASCHAVDNVQPRQAAPGLASLNPDSKDNCLSETVRAGLPQYQLSAGQRESLRAALDGRAGFAAALEPAAQVSRTMSALNCYACHERDGVGGADPARVGHFVMTAHFDMGDEGKLPPRLSGVGAKLKPAAMGKIISEGALHVRRHHMATRMPRFPKEQVATLIRDVAKADGAADEQGPAFSELAARDGRTLVGTRGMGCVNCHGVGDARSLGMPSVNLSPQFERLRWPWFKQLLLDPAKVNPGTRMPGFWADGHIVYTDLAGGTVDGQIAATWAYLSLGGSMPLPAGARPDGAGMELIPIEEPIVHRTFMADIGPRAIAVGFPDNLHIAFDANQVRLAKAWRGRFFDAKGMWEGRGGAHLAPLGKDVIDLPAGPALAVLATPDAPWPVAKGRRPRDLGGRFRGYRLDAKRQPVFMYQLGALAVEDQATPAIREGGVTLLRRITVTGEPPAAGKVYFLAAAGAKVEQESPGVWRVDDRLTVKFNAGAAGASVRELGAAKQLLVPVEPGGGAATTVEVEMAW